jgi:hypothetical protein
MATFASFQGVGGLVSSEQVSEEEMDEDELNPIV